MPYRHPREIDDFKAAQATPALSGAPLTKRPGGPVNVRGPEWRVAELAIQWLARVDLDRLLAALDRYYVRGGPPDIADALVLAAERRLAADPGCELSRLAVAAVAGRRRDRTALIEYLAANFAD